MSDEDYYDREYDKIFDDIYTRMVNYEFLKFKQSVKGIDVGDYPQIETASEMLDRFLAQEEYEKCALVKKFIKKIQPALFSQANRDSRN